MGFESLVIERKTNPNPPNRDECQHKIKETMPTHVLYQYVAYCSDGTNKEDIKE
jgi:hypothetical protein